MAGERKRKDILYWWSQRLEEGEGVRLGEVEEMEGKN